MRVPKKHEGKGISSEGMEQERIFREERNKANSDAIQIEHRKATPDKASKSINWRSKNESEKYHDRGKSF